MVTQHKNSKKIHLIISEEEIHRRIDQIDQLDCEDELRTFLIQALEALVTLDKIVGMKDTTIARLRKIFNKKVEKRLEDPPSDKNDDTDKPHPRGNNKGRNGKDKYPNANKVCHKHNCLKKGDRCPECNKGTLGSWDPGIYIKITGSPFLRSTIHETEKLRCNACQKIFEAEYEGKTTSKYDARAIAILAILKYRVSIPFYRTEKIQKQLLTPMPSSTQWDLVELLANMLHPVWKTLLKLASNGNLYYIDDTKGKIIDYLIENKKNSKNKEFRKGIYTTGIVSEVEKQKIILYLTGRKYAAENLDSILKHRDSMDPPIVMSDASSMNKSKEHDVLTALCNVHSRRKFFDLGEKFEDESNYVLDRLKKVFENERYTIDKNLSDKERLKYHQVNSLPIMLELKKWMDMMITEKKTEPNSSLGQSIKYCQKHWGDLLAFTRIAGAPLHNNLIESKLRQPVLNRKNWMFYKTGVGALVGDIILSIIKTAEEADVNIFDYLVWIQENTDDVKKNPENFSPWKFKESSPCQNITD